MPAFDGLWSLVTPPGRLLMLRHPGDILPVLHQQPPESLFYPVHVLISLPGVGSSSVTSPAHCPVQQRAPVRVLAEDVRITHHHQQSLGPESDTVNINWMSCDLFIPGDGHIEPLGVLQEAELVLVVSADVLRAGPDGAHDDHPPLLSLELLGAAHSHLLQVVPTQQLPHLLNLSPVGGDHPYLLGLYLENKYLKSVNKKVFYCTEIFLIYPVSSHFKKSFDVINGDCNLLGVEKAGTGFLFQVLADDSVEDHWNFVSLGLRGKTIENKTALCYHLQVIANKQKYPDVIL